MTILDYTEGQEIPAFCAVRGMPAEVYRKHPAISQSEFKHFCKELDGSPADYKVHKLLDLQQESAALSIGSAVDNWFTLGIKPDYYQNDAFKTTTETGRKNIKIVENCYLSLTNRDTVKTFFSGEKQLSMFAVVHGVAIKCRPDGYDEDYIVDLKTSADISRHEFSKSLGEWGYFIQAAWYQLIAGIVDPPQQIESELTHKTETVSRSFVLVCVDKSTYRVKIYPVSPIAIWKGMQIINSNLPTFAECMKNDYWPDAIEELDMPKWFYDKLEGK